MNYLLFNSESIKAPVLIKNICLKKKISDILSFSILINITYHIMFLILKFKYFKKIHISYKKIITYRWDANIPKFYHLLQFIAYFRNIILTANVNKSLKRRKIHFLNSSTIIEQ
uniref:Uncharacterized protein n=1 Tax=Amorphochlora amoebiformis TaxID=1561963 RepID=A0A0H5BHS3_9EUKA|nr:hypothetical protein [Amorphochlora amoebiformis]